ncbi:MAG: YwaF family protein [Solobacterium sp.]|nr:YwaF family protein [Solobacterium sp.]
MNLCFEHVPEMYGYFHLAMLILISIAGFLVWRISRGYSGQRLIRMIGVLGWIMVLLEVFKQWFCVTVVNHGVVSLWYLPWQLCSIAMYVSSLLPFLGEQRQNTVLSFLATYSLMAAVLALLYPQDMLRIQVLLSLHGFLYHGFMILQSVLALRVLQKRKCMDMRRCTVLFLGCACIAEVLNISAYVFFPALEQPNLFYISPYMPVSQPVFADIAGVLGILPEIVVYLGMIILVNYLLSVMFDKTILRKYNSNHE